MLTNNPRNSRTRSSGLLGGQRPKTAVNRHRITTQPPVRMLRDSYRSMHLNGDDEFVIPEFLPGELDELNQFYGDDIITF